MARKRLNKKVALIGSVVFALLALGIVVVLLGLSRDPAQFIADGDAAWAGKDYEAARRNYAKAIGLSQEPEAKIELLFKLADVFKATDQWPKVLACWEQIITSDPQNLAARLGRLKYVYMLADSLADLGQPMDERWKELAKQATDLIAIAERADVLDAEKAQWEPSFGAAEEPGWDGDITRLGPYLYFVKGRAAYELASMGAATSPDALLVEAEADLTRARDLAPGNPHLYHALAEVFLQRGDNAASRGNFDERDASQKRANEILAAGVEAAGNAPDGYVNALTRKLTGAQREDVEASRAQLKALAPEYQVLAAKFPDSAKACAALARFHAFTSAYSDSAVAGESLDRALEAAEKACRLDATSVKYARFAAALYYRQFSLYQDESSLQKAIEMAERGLTLPDAQRTPGPRYFAKQTNRLSLCSLLAQFYIEQILTRPMPAIHKDEILAKAENVVHEIEQIQGSGQNVHVVKWQGMLELARGHTGKAVQSLYAAHEQIKASNAPGERDAFLAYTLATIFKGTSEIGAFIDFVQTALNSGIIDSKPQALLDYADALLEAASYDAALRMAVAYDGRFGPNPRSRQLAIRTRIAQGLIPEAQAGIAQLPSDDPNTLALSLDLVRAEAAQLAGALAKAEKAATAPFAKDPGGAQRSTETLRAELRDCRLREAKLTLRLLPFDLASVGKHDLAMLCANLIAQDAAATARDVVDAVLQRHPDNVAALFYDGVLAEPDPRNCPESRRKEIQEQAIGRMGDPVQRAIELGQFYQQGGQPDKAVPQWRKVLDATVAQEVQAEPAYLRAKQPSPRNVAAGQLFDIAREKKDWTLAAEVVDIAKKDNLDDCDGHLFAGRLAFAQGQYKDAVTHLDACLKLRPIFSYGYMLRGNVRTAMGDGQASVDDIKTASRLNPADPLVAKALANALFLRDKNLGEKVSSEQQLETRRALEHAIRLNPRDTVLLVAYADLVSESEPLTALALRQTIQINTPSVSNAVVLGKLATRIALQETDKAKKAALFTIGESAFEQARQMDPSNQFMLESYAEHYRAREQNDKARQLLAESRDSRLLWRHYFRVGRYEEARGLLEQMYQTPAERPDALKGLVLVAQATSDKASVKTYSEELLSLEDNVVNRLAQIRACLDVGLVQEAETKLEAFKTTYPDDGQVSLMEALLAMRQGQLKRAFDLTNKTLETNQRDAGAWRLRGEIDCLRADYSQAILDFQKSRSLENDPVTTVALAKAFIWAGRDQDAMGELRGLLVDPAAPPEARTLLERLYLRRGQTATLKQFYEETLAVDPDNVFWLNRAGAFAVGQSDYDRAEAWYGRAYQIVRERAAARRDEQAKRELPYAATLDGYLHALVLSAGEPTAAGGLRHPEKLDAVFAEGGNYVDTVYADVAFYHMADAKKRLGQMDAARDYCRRAVDKAWADERLAAEVLLRIYFLMGGSEVSGYCRERLQTNPDSVAANFTMFNLAKIQGDYDNAVDYIDKCIRLSGSDSERGIEYAIKKAQLLTIAHKKTSERVYLNQAIAVYQSLLAKMPKNSSVLNNLAYMLAQDDRKLAEALDHARQALAQKPDEANYLDTYAYVLHKSGRNDEAAESLAAAIQQYEISGAASPEVYEHLGMVKEALGQRPQALAAYRRVLEVGADTLSDGARERINVAIKRLAQ